ncbi:MAG: alpha/beta fold hydrolase [Idiomarina sp.]
MRDAPVLDAELIPDPQRPADTSPEWPAFFRDHVQTFWHQHCEEVSFVGEDKLQLNAVFCVPAASTQVVVVSPGRIEAAMKYQEFVWEMAQLGVAVAILDHRGQGKSGRMTTNPNKGHVHSFGHYVNDFGRFCHLVNERLPSHRQVLLAHSMGGAIAALYMAEHEHKLQAAVFSAPMLSISSGWVPTWLARAAVTIGSWLNQRLAPLNPWYFFGMGDYQSLTFEDNVLTSSRARYRAFREVYETDHELKLGGPTFSWLREALLASENAIGCADKITIPVRVLQAGGDRVIKPDGQIRFASRLTHPNSGLKVIAHSQHEIVMETDRYRDQLLRELKRQLEMTK